MKRCCVLRVYGRMRNATPVRIFLAFTYHFRLNLDISGFRFVSLFHSSSR